METFLEWQFISVEGLSANELRFENGIQMTNQTSVKKFKMELGINVHKKIKWNLSASVFKNETLTVTSSYFKTKNGTVNMEHPGGFTASPWAAMLGHGMHGMMQHEYSHAAHASMPMDLHVPQPFPYYR